MDTTGITTSNAARALGVSSRTIIEWTKTGLLHPKRSASGWRYFDPAEVEQLARSRAKKFA